MNKMSVNELVEQWLFEYACRHSLYAVLNGRWHWNTLSVVVMRDQNVVVVGYRFASIISVTLLSNERTHGQRDTHSLCSPTTSTTIAVVWTSLRLVDPLVDVDVEIHNHRQSL